MHVPQIHVILKQHAQRQVLVVIVVSVLLVIKEMERMMDLNVLKLMLV